MATTTADTVANTAKSAKKTPGKAGHWIDTHKPLVVGLVVIFLGILYFVSRSAGGNTDSGATTSLGDAGYGPGAVLAGDPYGAYSAPPSNPPDFSQLTASIDALRAADSAGFAGIGAAMGGLGAADVAGFGQLHGDLSKLIQAQKHPSTSTGKHKHVKGHPVKRPTKTVVRGKGQGKKTTAPSGPHKWRGAPVKAKQGTPRKFKK